MSDGNPSKSPAAEPEEEPIGPDSLPETYCSEDEARTWSMACHLAGLGLFVLPPFTGVIATLIVWLFTKRRHPLIDANGKEALNFQISVLIYLTVALLMLFAICISIPLLITVGIFDLVFTVIAIVKSNQGQAYRYPLCMRFVK